MYSHKVIFSSVFMLRAAQFLKVRVQCHCYHNVLFLSILYSKKKSANYENIVKLSE